MEYKQINILHLQYFVYLSPNHRQKYFRQPLCFEYASTKAPLSLCFH